MRSDKQSNSSNQDTASGAGCSASVPNVCGSAGWISGSTSNTSSRRDHADTSQASGGSSSSPTENNCPQFVPHSGLVAPTQQAVYIAADASGRETGQSETSLPTTQTHLTAQQMTTQANVGAYPIVNNGQMLPQSVMNFSDPSSSTILSALGRPASLGGAHPYPTVLPSSFVDHIANESMNQSTTQRVHGQFLSHPDVHITNTQLGPSAGGHFLHGQVQGGAPIAMQINSSTGRVGQSLIYVPVLVQQLPNSTGTPLIRIGTQEDINTNTNVQDDPEKKKKKRKRKEKEKAEGLPRRPLTAYNMYFRDEKNRIFGAIDAGLDPEELVKNPLASLQDLLKKTKQREETGPSGSDTQNPAAKLDDEGTSNEDNGTSGTSQRGDTSDTTKETEKGGSSATTEEESLYDSKKEKFPSCLKSDAFMKSRVPGSKRMRALPHGKIAFAKLARIVGARWKALDKGTVGEYDKLAAEDTKRYRRELKEFKKKELNEAQDRIVAC